MKKFNIGNAAAKNEVPEKNIKSGNELAMEWAGNCVVWLLRGVQHPRI